MKQKIIDYYNNKWAFLSLENKLFNGICIIFILVSFFSAITNYFINLDYRAIILSIFTFFIYSYLFYKSVFYNKFEFLKKSFLFFSLLCLSISWILSNGFSGATTFLYLSFSVTSILMLKQKESIIFIIILLLNIVCLFLIEINYPDFITYYPDYNIKLYDLFSTLIIMLLFQSIYLIFFKKSYDSDRKFLIRNKKELEESQKKLIESKEISEASSKIKSEFLANMSHEIRTPLNAIIGMNDLLIRSNLTLEQKELVENVTLSGNLLLELINDILDISKIESEKIILEEIDFNLESLLNEIININKLKIKSTDKEIEINYNYDSKLNKKYLGDPTKIKQILLNLISNAIKFTEKGKIEINISLNKDIDTSNSIIFSVKDSGIGISEQDQEKLFKPFSQIDASITRKYGGTGLGLLISKKLVELMNGYFSLHSKLGDGSEFYFILNLKKSSESNLKEVVSIDKNQIVNNKKNKKPKILIAEDNLMNQKLVIKILEKLSYKADIANNGLEAVKKVESNTYDLIFMDVQMPEMSGLEATQKIRENNKFSSDKLIIIAMTANAMLGDREKCLKSGMNDYISKPISLDKVEALIFKWA